MSKNKWMETFNEKASCKKCGCTVNGAIEENACVWCGNKYLD